MVSSVEKRNRSTGSGSLRQMNRRATRQRWRHAQRRERRRQAPSRHGAPKWPRQDDSKRRKQAIGSGRVVSRSFAGACARKGQRISSVTSGQGARERERHVAVIHLPLATLIGVSLAGRVGGGNGACVTSDTFVGLSRAHGGSEMRGCASPDTVSRSLQVCDLRRSSSCILTKRAVPTSKECTKSHDRRHHSPSPRN